MTADDTVTAKLAEWEALANAATEGPWEVVGDEVHAPHLVEQVEPTEVADVFDFRRDAEFIAAARQMVPALLAFVREVRELHAPSEIARCGEWTPYCKADGENWPCPTEQAARKWLGGEG